VGCAVGHAPIVPARGCGPLPGVLPAGNQPAAGRAVEDDIAGWPATEPDGDGPGAAYAGDRSCRRRTETTVWRLIGILLVVWLVVTVIGAVVKGLFWLAVVGLLFFAATAALGWNKRQNELPPGRR
jgi:hypothetical protein